VAGSATSRKRLTFNNMRGTRIPLPISIAVGPGEEVELRLEMQMHQGMEGFHVFHLPLAVEGKDQPLNLYVRGLFR